MKFETHVKITKSQSSTQVVKDSYSQSSSNLEGNFQNPNPYAEDPFQNKSLTEVDEDNLPF